MSQDTQDRERALAAAIEQAKKLFGAGAVMRLGE